MRYVIMFRVPHGLTEAEEEFKFYVRNQINYETRNFFRRSLLFVKRKIEIGYHEYDFSQNMVTIRVVGNVYKLNRIVKYRGKHVGRKHRSWLKLFGPLKNKV